MLNKIYFKQKKIIGYINSVIIKCNIIETSLDDEFVILNS